MRNLLVTYKRNWSHGYIYIYIYICKRITLQYVCYRTIIFFSGLDSFKICQGSIVGFGIDDDEI
jgi:hypothetical protein